MIVTKGRTENNTICQLGCGMKVSCNDCYAQTGGNTCSKEGSTETDYSPSRVIVTYEEEKI